MYSETTIAVTYIVGPLYTNLPRRRVDDFALELDKLLKLKISPFWFPNQPFSGIHQRCLRVNGPYADPIIGHAATRSSINPDEIFSLLPRKELKIWIDPAEVSYQLGDQNSEIKYLLRRAAPNAFIETLEPSNMCVAKPETPLFTVSSFAKTKFGSTKLKSSSAIGLENVRPDSLKLLETGISGIVSPSIPNSLNSPETSGINISCCLPWAVDINNNSYSNLLTINIPHYSQTNGRDSSASGSLNSELNSPVHGY